MFYILWAVLLILQNAAFTWVSRARNSGSDWYHAIAAVFSNGIWLFATFFTFDKVFFAVQEAGWSLEVSGAVVLYIITTVTGSVFMGKFLRRFVERGKRKVGHYDAGEARIVQLEEQVRLLARIIERLPQPRSGSQRARMREVLATRRQALDTEGQAEAESTSGPEPYGEDPDPLDAPPGSSEDD